MSNFGQIANRGRVVYADLHFNDADCESWCLEVSGDRKIFDMWMACATLEEIAGACDCAVQTVDNVASGFSNQF
jgi:hypothetical protein